MKSCIRSTPSPATRSRRANSDLQNLFENTEVATVFLDESLTIRSFTPSVAQTFNVLPGDRASPITDLASRLNLATPADDIAHVLAEQKSRERQAVGLLKFGYEASS
jgi:two-component system CheB/CheR fusion protein